MDVELIVSPVYEDIIIPVTIQATDFVIDLDTQITDLNIDIAIGGQNGLPGRDGKDGETMWYLVDHDHISPVNTLKIYADIIDGIPLQLQSDYNQLDNTKLDYIKNKPLIPSLDGYATELFVTDITDHKEEEGVAQDLIIALGLGTVVIHNYDEFALALTSDENYVTDLEKTNLHAPHSDDQDLSPYQLLSEKGAINGYAGLDANQKLFLVNLPDSILGQLQYQGTWDVSVGSYPSNALKGYYWIAINTGIISSIEYSTGDWIVYNGVSFDKIDNTAAVTSVSGRTGNVILNKSDVGLDLVDNTSDMDKPISTATQIELDYKVTIQAVNLALSFKEDISNKITDVLVDSEVEYPSSSLVLNQLNLKVDKVDGSRLITTPESVILGNTSNINSGDNAINTRYSGLVTFPGFGNTHLLSAYGDHLHTGIYEPILGVPLANNYVLSSDTGGIRSWSTVNSKLTTGYGDTINPYTVKLAKTFLAAPVASTGNASFRLITASDIPALPYSPSSTVSFPGFGVITNKAWGFDAHPTTISGYGITDLPNITKLYSTDDPINTYISSSFDGQYLQLQSNNGRLLSVNHSINSNVAENCNTLQGYSPSTVAVDNGTAVVVTDINGYVNGKRFVKSGGLATEFLMADGSVQTIGPKGDKGDTGLTGEQGIQGIRGIKGDVGSQGLQGIQGPIGNTGLTGAKGDQGIQGIQGLKGDQGIQGVAGTVNINGLGFVKANGNTISYDNNTYSTIDYVDTKISDLIDSSPALLDTLNELSAALGDDPNFSTTVMTAIGSKQSQLDGVGLVRMNNKVVSYDNNPYITSNSIGYLNTLHTEMQGPDPSESFSSTINLHKIAKTGYYTDLLGRPTQLSQFTNNLDFTTKTYVDSNDLWELKNPKIELVDSVNAYEYEDDYKNVTVFFKKSTFNNGEPISLYLANGTFVISSTFSEPSNALQTTIPFPDITSADLYRDVNSIGSYVISTNSINIPRPKNGLKINMDDVNELDTEFSKKTSNPLYNTTISKLDLTWKNGWIIISTIGSWDNRYTIKITSLLIKTFTGIKKLNPIVLYPSKDTYNGTLPAVFYLRDVDGFLREDYEFEEVSVSYDITSSQNSNGYNSLKENLGENVIDDGNAGDEWHSNIMVQCFNLVYPGFLTKGLSIIETLSDPITGNNDVEADFTATYLTIKNANMVIRPYTGAADSEESYSNPNVLTTASHFANAFQRRDITLNATTFLRNTIAVGARPNDTTSMVGVSYGFGMEFFEDTSYNGLNAIAAGLGNIYYTDPQAAPIYMESPVCAIVAAKLKNIKLESGVNWSIVRKAARATASNNGVWDMYRGFGSINVTAAIQWIKDNYTENVSVRNYIADKLESDKGISPILKYSDLYPNSPVSKKMTDLILKGYVNTDQSTQQTIGSISNRLGKLWGSDVDFNNMPIVAGTSLNNTFLSLNGGSMNNINLVGNLNAQYFNGKSDALFIKNNGYLTANQDLNSLQIGINANGGNSGNNSPNVNEYGVAFTISTDPYYGWQMYQDNDGQLHSRSAGTGTWNSWRKILDDQNFTPANYIQNSPTSAQSGSVWVDGVVRSAIYKGAAYPNATSFGDDTDVSYTKLYAGSTAGSVSGIYIQGGGASNPNTITLKTSSIDRLIINADGAATFASTVQTTGITPTNLTTGYIPMKSSGVLVDSPLSIVSEITTITTGDQASSRFNIINTSGHSFSLVAGQTNESQDGFSIYDTSLDATRLAVTNSGNVGIGYSTGTEITNNKLAVNGSGHFNGDMLVYGGIASGGRISAYTIDAGVDFILSNVNRSLIGTDYSENKVQLIGVFEDNLIHIDDNGYGVNFNGSIKSNNLSGTGTRMVVADSLGVLSTQTIPSGGGGGSVVSVGIDNANGFYGSSSGGVNPSLNIKTNINGVLLGNGISVSALNGSGFLKINGSGVSFDNNDYIPYVGATANVDLGTTHTITANNFILSSDKRLKENILPISTKILDIEYKEFEMISTPGEKRYGVLAQDLREVAPELVNEDENGILSVKYIDLLIRKIAELENRVKQLEGK